MIATIISNVRNLINDQAISGYEVFQYETINTFTLLENANSISRVMVDRVATTDYTFSSSTNEITVTASGLTSGDIVQVDYIFNKYSDTELTGYINAAITWINVYSGTEYAVSGTTIDPTPDRHSFDLIAMVASILIQPDYTSYKLPNIAVTYNNKMTKEQKIEELVSRVSRSIGVNGVLNFNIATRSSQWE